MRAAGDFRFIVGIENAFIPDMGVDELGWTRHRERWREDLKLAREVGADAIRYGITWPEVNLAPGRYDWAWCDGVINELERLGLEPIWDMVHFGVPAFLEEGFLDEGYVGAVAAYARAFAQRYRGFVAKITPLNEPYISTYFRAGRGIWPPYHKGRESFARMLHPIVEGLKASIRAIKEENPAAEIWLNDGADEFHPAGPDLADEAAKRTQERYAAFDLLLGLTEPGQETYEWLKEEGYPEADLKDEPVPVDVIGLDYYPDTEHELYQDADGSLAIRKAPRMLGVAHMLEVYHARYGRPLFIAESSHSGDDEARRAWLAYNLDEIARVMDKGVLVLGYTWWPLFDHVDWNTLLTRRDGFICSAGLYHLRPTTSDRQPTDAARAFLEATMRRTG